MVRSIFSMSQTWLFSAWFNFVVVYRRTIIGPFWLLVSPAMFIGFLGLLFTEINDTTLQQFVPHLAIGFVAWTLISGLLINSTTIFQRHQPQLMQSGWTITDIVMVDVINTVLQFLHQIPVAIAVMLIFKIPLSFYSLVSLLGILLVVVNGIWLAYFFGTIGARYRDLSQIVQSIMGIAFLATPILWMPRLGARGGILDIYKNYNPFFHFMEIIRAPLLDLPISNLSWIVTSSFTVIGALLAIIFYRRYSKLVALWV